jgi:hypothetical protein
MKMILAAVCAIIASVSPIASLNQSQYNTNVGEVYGLDGWVVEEGLWATEDGNLWNCDTEGYEKGETYLLLFGDMDTQLDQTDDVIISIQTE